MNVTVAAGAALVLAASTTLGGPGVTSRLFAPESRITYLDGPACAPDRAGAGLTRSPAGWACSAPARTRLAVHSDPQGTTVTLRSPEGPSAHLDVPGFVLDRAIEWRGSGTRRAFDLRAGILRLEEPARGTRKAGEEMLAVVQVSAGRLCLAGLVDGAATAGAASLARSLADELPRSAACGREARIYGVVTRRARDLVARL